MTSEAIVIGVNNYEFLQPLKYAQQDALAVKQFLENEARFDRVYYFAEDAPAVNGVSMRPTRNNIRRVMRETFAKPFMRDGDNFWFFFSGHGMRSGERDFLMPIDGDPDDVVESGISTAQVSEWLRGCGADNVVMVLDACRSGGMKDGKGIGDETREGCRQTGVISLFSCSPNQFSYELEAHQQGAFTKVLLEGLGVQGGCATVARLDEYLKRRVPEIVRDCLGDRVTQVPYSIAEPINRSHLILMPQHSRPEDLNALKMDAFRAEKTNDLRLAYQCWLRVNIASWGTDMEAIGEIVKLHPQMSGFKTQPQTKFQSTSEVSFTKAPRIDSGSSIGPLLKDFTFETVQLNPKGQVTGRTTKTGKLYLEELTDSVFLEMVQIPEGKFIMGSPASEKGRSDDEGPQREVNVSSFFMSKTPITQAQWNAVVRLPKVNIDLPSNPSRFKAPKRPVEEINWFQAEEFCNRLGIKTKRDYRLPSEAEWEYACRSGTKTPFYFGETLSAKVANYNALWTYGLGVNGKDHEQTTDVESFPANAWGIYDMHGNVWEWCADHWSENYEAALKDSNPFLSKEFNFGRVERGGSWVHDPGTCRSASRIYSSPLSCNVNLGLRLVCSLSSTFS